MLGTPIPISMVADPITGALTATPIVVHPGANGVLSAADLQTLQNANVTRFRYDFSGASASANWTPGTVALTPGTWKDSAGDQAQAPAPPMDFEVLGPTADLVSPTNGSGIDVNTLNGRSYVDVTLPEPPTGYTIDWSAITSTTPIFTFSGPGAGTAAVDPTQAPFVLDPTARTVRYWTTGNFASGDVTAVFVPGGPPLTETALGDALHDDGPVAIDVTFVGIPIGDVLDPSTVAFTATHTPFVLDPTATGLGSVTINPTVAPIVLADGKTVRYAVSGSFAAGGTVTVTFNRGTWSVKPLGGGVSTVDTGTGTTQVTLGTVPSVAGSYPSFAVEGESIDVAFPVPVGETIDPGSLAGADQVTLGGAVLAPTSIDVVFPVAAGFILDPTTLSGSAKFTLDATAAGLGSVAIVTSVAPQVLADGITVRYAVTGQFAAGGGAVNVSFNRGTWNVLPVAGGTSTADPASGTTHVTLGTVPAGALPSFASGGVTIDTSVAPQLLPGGTTVRYRLKGVSATGETITPSLSAGTITASFTPGTWSYVPATAAVGTVTDGVASFAIDTGMQTIDVTFPVQSGYVLDPTSLTASPVHARRSRARDRPHQGRDRHELRAGRARGRRDRPLSHHRSVRRRRRRRHRNLRLRHVDGEAGGRRRLDGRHRELHEPGHDRHRRRWHRPVVRQRGLHDRRRLPGAVGRPDRLPHGAGPAELRRYRPRLDRDRRAAERCSPTTPPSGTR